MVDDAAAAGDLLVDEVVELAVSVHVVNLLFVDVQLLVQVLLGRYPTLLHQLGV